MRIGLALVVLLDLFIKCNNVFAFYGEEGVFPNHLVYSYSGKTGMWSLCTLFESNAWVVFLYGLSILFAITFLIGYKTKWSNLLLWILVVSFQNRNIYVLQAGDDLLRLTLMLCFFLPTHHYFSFDVKTKINQFNYLLAKLAYLILISSVYIFSVFLKLNSDWLAQGSAIYYALSLDVFRTNFFGEWLYSKPMLMQGLTWLTVLIEILIPILILFPSKKNKLRRWAFVLIVLLHFSIALFLHVGLFFMISIVVAMGLLSPQIISEDKTNSSIKNKLPFNFIKNTFLIFFIWVVLFFNLSTLPQFNYQLNDTMLKPIYFLRLDQFWGMFAPNVSRQNSWLVFEAHNAKGQQFDIAKDSEYVDFKKSENFTTLFPNDRWRKLHENIENDNFQFLRPHFCKYMLLQWNKTHPENKMASLNLYKMTEINSSNYKKSQAIKYLLCNCNAQ